MTGRFHLNIGQLFFLLFGVTRLLILITPGNTFDNESFIAPVIEIFNGRNPYQSPTLGIEEIVYPPLFYLILSTFFWVFGMNTFALGVCLVIFDLGTVLILYKIAGLVIEDESKRYLPLFFYAFFPLTLFVLTVRILAPIATFFFVLAIFFHLKKKPFLTGVFAAIGFQIEIFPAFLIYIIGLLFFAHKQYKKMFELILAFVLVFFSINLPFFNFNPIETLNIIMIHFRRSGSLSLIYAINDLIYIFTGNPNPFTVQVFTGFSIDISTMITIAGLIIFGYWVIKVGKHNKVITPRDELKIIFFFFLFLPIITLNIYFRAFYWSLTLPALLLNYPDKNSFRNRSLKRFFLGIILGLSIALIYFSTIMPGTLFYDLSLHSSQFYTIPHFNIYYLLSLLVYLVGLVLLWQPTWVSMFRVSTVNQISGLTPVIKMILTVSLLGMVIAVTHKFNHTPIVVEIRSLVKIAVSIIGLCILSLELYKYLTLNFPQNSVRNIALIE